MSSPVSVDDIVKRYEVYGNTAASDLIRRAHNFSHLAHSGQVRKSGEPYIDHPMHVALILTQLKMDAATIAAALLHDTVEDTKTSVKDVSDNFGQEIADLVDGVTKISSISFSHKHEAQAESFRKMLLAMAKDIRVIIIKLADRLHNIRTLNHLSEDKQRLIARETLDIYAPLANRLGISWVKVELEDQAFRYLKPMMYMRLNKKLSTTRKWREGYIARVIERIKRELKTHDINAEVTGRHKHYYSICRKMEKRGLDFDEISDILAFRVIVDTTNQCYEVLGILHSLWKPIPGKFKDYIAIPKVNLYQSLHTTVSGLDGERIEIQIRTHEMHSIAEEGIASHWMYKEGTSDADQTANKFQWLRSMVDWEKDLKDSNEFIQTVKLDLFEDQVYVFSPKGDVFELPRGATPIDFAFRVHSEVGQHCTGARVNGKMVPIRYKLQNGDQVELLTSDNQKPSKDWLKFVVTSKAKAKVRAFLRTEERSMGISIGRELLEQELKKLNLSVNKFIRGGQLEAVAESMNYRGYEDLLMAIGFGKAALNKVLGRLVQDEDLDENGVHRESFIEKLVSRVTPKTRSTIKVGGLDDVMVRMGKCCNPIPGDPIVGFVTRGRGVTVHHSECPKVLETSDERKVHVAWSTQGSNLHLARIRVFTVDTPGILANVSQAISQAGANITSANISTTVGKKAMNTFELELKNTSQLNSILKLIERLDGVLSVERVRG